MLRDDGANFESVANFESISVEEATRRVVDAAKAKTQQKVNEGADPKQWQRWGILASVLMMTMLAGLVIGGTDDNGNSMSAARRISQGIARISHKDPDVADEIMHQRRNKELKAELQRARKTKSEGEYSALMHGDKYKPRHAVMPTFGVSSTTKKDAHSEGSSKHESAKHRKHATKDEEEDKEEEEEEEEEEEDEGKESRGKGRKSRASKLGHWGPPHTNEGHWGPSTKKAPDRSSKGSRKRKEAEVDEEKEVEDDEFSAAKMFVKDHLKKGMKLPNSAQDIMLGGKGKRSGAGLGARHHHAEPTGHQSTHHLSQKELHEQYPLAFP